MIKKETILSVFDEKLTLLQFLKTIEKGLKDGVVTAFNCVQVDETHVKFNLTFMDESVYESEVIELPQGPQGPQGPPGPQGPQGPQGPAGENAKMYLHVVSISNNTLDVRFNIYTSNNTPFDYDNLLQFLSENGLVVKNKSITGCGRAKTNSNVFYVDPVLFSYNDGTNNIMRVTAWLSGTNGTFQNNDVSNTDTITDLVIEL